MICVYLTVDSVQIMSPSLEGEHYSNEFHVMSGRSSLVILELPRGIRNHFAVLHEHNSSFGLRGITVYGKPGTTLRYSEDGYGGQPLLQLLKAPFTRLRPIILMFLTG